MVEVTLEDLSPAQIKKLEAELRKKQKAKSAEADKAEKAYQKRKQDFLKKARIDGLKLQKQMIAYKTFLFTNAKALQAEMLANGEISKKSTKGGYTIFNTDDSFKLNFQPRGVKTFDETVAVAEGKLREFLEQTVKVKSKTHFAMIDAILEKSQGGEYNPDLVNRLVKVQDQINDPAFDEVVTLFQKAWKETGTSTYVNLYERVGIQEKWEHMTFQLSQLPIAE